MATVNLQAHPREGTGKGTARKLRQADRIPAVLYGHGTDPVNLSFGALEVRKALSTSAGSNAVIKLEVEGDRKERAAIFKAIQRHPVSRKIIHLDLLSIDLNQPVEVSVHVRPLGIPIGVKLEGGVLGWARRDVRIRVLPTRIPEAIDLDISGLHVNQVVHVGDLVMGEGVEVLDDADTTLCSVASSRLKVDEDTAGEEVAEEPTTGTA
jgi:large subunit ribosomal protein L25